MINMEKLPNAWSIAESISGGEARQLVGLYDLYYDIAIALFNYRKDNKLTQKELASKLGVTQAMVSKLESGDYNYTIEQLWKIAKNLDFELDIIFSPRVNIMSTTPSQTKEETNYEYAEVLQGAA